jgi:hypothetical protein
MLQLFIWILTQSLESGPPVSEARIPVGEHMFDNVWQNIGCSAKSVGTIASVHSS